MVNEDTVFLKCVQRTLVLKIVWGKGQVVVVGVVEEVCEMLHMTSFLLKTQYNLKAIKTLNIHVLKICF